MTAGCLLFYPAAEYSIFGIFILGYFILAGGITILQVAANPYVTILGPEKTASSRLNLSQAFNSLGTAIAPALGALFILQGELKTAVEINAMDEAAELSYFEAEASAVQLPFLALAIFIILIALMFYFVSLPKVTNEKASNDYSRVLRNKNLLLGAVGIFCYVGAEVALGSYMVNYFLSLNLAESIRDTPIMSSIAGWILNIEVANVSNMALVGVFVAFYWSGAMVGRFIGSYLTSVINPAKVLAWFAFSALILILISNISLGFVAMWTIIAIGLFNSIMFPTIFSL